MPKSRQVKHEKVFGPSPLATACKEVIALLEADGYTLRKLQIMKPARREELIKQYANQIGGIDPNAR